MVSRFVLNVPTDISCYATLLRHSCSSTSISHGNLVFYHIAHESVDKNCVFVVNLVLRMYGICGSMDDAFALFLMMEEKDKFSWNFIIRSCVLNRRNNDALHLFYSMIGEGFLPDNFIYPSILSSCNCHAHLSDGKRIHDLIKRSECAMKDIVVANALITMYANCGSLEDARAIFNHMFVKDVITWNAIINAYAQHQQGQDVMDLYKKMDRIGGIRPTKITFVSILLNFGNTLTLMDAKYIHNQVREKGFEADLIVGNAIINMYLKCNGLADAKLMFENMLCRDIVSWNGILKVYVQHGDHKNVIHHFLRMQVESIFPDKSTYATVLTACANRGALCEGKRIHSCIIPNEIESDAFTMSVLVSLYCKCGTLQEAEHVFEMMHDRDIFCWNNMIAINAQHSKVLESLKLFHRMQEEGLIPDKFVFASAISACINKETLVEGQLLHTLVIESCCEMDTAVGTALVNMYGKSCDLEKARVLFSKMTGRNTLSWSSMIAILVHYGQGKHALTLLPQMFNEGILPNKASYVNLLSACATLADLTRGRQLHTHIYGIESQFDVVLGTALLTMYGKCGNVEDASSVFDDMQEHNTLSWNAFFITCAQCGQGVRALNMFQFMHRTTITPDNATFISLLSACSHSGLVDDCIVCFSLINWVVLDGDHFNCMIDALGRVGRIDDAKSLLDYGPFHPTITSWIILLYCSRNLYDMKKGDHAAMHGWELNPEISGPYITLSNMCVGKGNNFDGHDDFTEQENGICGNYTQ